MWQAYFILHSDTTVRVLVSNRANRPSFLFPQTMFWKVLWGTVVICKHLWNTFEFRVLDSTVLPIWIKEKKVLNSTTTAAKYILKRPRICNNWNPPFQTQIYLVKVPLNVNIVKKIYFIKNIFWKFYQVRSERRDFNWYRVWGLLGMYFDAVVVEVKTFLILFRLTLAILW
jgi:hypothetical protein